MKTCPYCLGKGQIITNAGTGLKKPCPKCVPVAPPETKPKTDKTSETKQ